MFVAGIINVGKYNNKGELQYDHDIQEFENLLFKIKVKTLEDEDNSARLFFFNNNLEKEIEVLNGIICKDVTFKKKTEYERHEKKENKRLSDAINSITDLNLNDSEYDDEDSDDMDIKKE
ncbi:7060_t:CDS:2 [Cetraspora pellucida]|uniref:7060_t:CDS:1 n=1 Tax=Cetraspora pellucida TaxID=1433469 RepID=A0ACA9MCJ7_9GLOM|nr:7060_t:CDS:2 [Cetraspora pellucida]